jgi:glutathione S-transferase
VGRLPSLSPYCWKVQMALALKGIAFEVRDTLNAKKSNPSGKLPYLEIDGVGYEDSTHIVRVLDAMTDSGPRLIPTDPGEAADANILDDWADESLYWHGVRAKFIDDDGWRHVEPELARHLPAKMLRVAMPLVRRDLRKKLESQGLARRADELVDEEFDRHLDSLEGRLEGRDYLVGPSITIADLAVTSMVGQLTVGLTPPFAVRIASRPSLSRYLERVIEQTGSPTGDG